MQKINFQNLPSTATPINATNLNAMQNNVETAINDVASNLSDCASYYINSTVQMDNVSAWTAKQLPFNGNGTFQTNNSNSFEQNGNYIKSKFKGKVLILREVAIDQQGELDIIDEYGYMTATATKQNYSFSIADVDVGTNINFIINGAMSGTVYLYSARLIVLRII